VDFRKAASEFAAHDGVDSDHHHDPGVCDA
jgi:hypothetical protein